MNQFSAGGRGLVIAAAAIAVTSSAFAQYQELDGPGAKPPAPARIEAETPPSETEQPDGAWEKWVKTKEDLREKYGTELSLNGDVTGRTAMAGPETLERAVARYDILIRQHFGDDALISMDTRGGWGQGLDPYLGLFANTDQFAQTNEQIFILHLYYQQQLLEDQLTLRLGKFDIGDWIDTNRYGYYNFLGYSFAHNATIALPGNTLGAMASWEPKDAGWYIAGGASNSAVTPFESGIKSTFEGDAEWLSIAELGIKPKLMGREGVYRFTGWHNGRDFFTTSGETESGAVGAALSFDQDLTERLGTFARFGAVDGDPMEPKRYYSAGIYVKEPLPGRDKDSLALGVVVNEFTDAFVDSVPDAEDAETYVELYYNWQITPWAQLQPVFQVVDNPGGRDQTTALIAGAHLALRF